MNKHEFIEELSRQTNYSIEDCTKISDVLDDNFFISKKNKNKIITKLIEELNYSEEEADNIYNTSASIIVKEIRNKIRHPFRSKD